MLTNPFLAPVSFSMALQTLVGTRFLSPGLPLVRITVDHNRGLLYTLSQDAEITVRYRSFTASGFGAIVLDSQDLTYSRSMFHSHVSLCSIVPQAYALGSSGKDLRHFATMSYVGFEIIVEHVFILTVFRLLSVCVCVRVCLAGTGVLVAR